MAGYAGADGKDGGSPRPVGRPRRLHGNLEYSGGPNVCGECHLKEFNDWLARGHSHKLALAFELGEGVPVVCASKRWKSRVVASTATS